MAETRAKSSAQEGPEELAVRQGEVKIEVVIEGATCRSCGQAVAMRFPVTKREDAEEYMWALNDFGEVHRTHIGFEVIGTVTTPEKYHGQRISLEGIKSK